MHVEDLVYEYLRQEEIETVFTLASTGYLDLMARMEEEDDFDTIHARHEEGAVSMADAYSRASGDIGLSLIGMGPAIAHTGTALVTARKFGSKLLVVVPTSSMSHTKYTPEKRFELYNYKNFDQDEYLQSTVGNVLTVRSPDAAVPTFREAFRRIRTGSGPVALQIPMDVFDMELTTDIADENLTRDNVYNGPETRVRPDSSQVDEAVDLYLDSDVRKTPVILAGVGAMQSDARDEIERLAERMNAVIATTLQARGYLSDHPFSVGLVGTLGSNLANTYLTESDYVIAAGCSLNIWTTDEGHLIDDDAKIIHIDVDRSSFERYTQVSLGIQGDAKATLGAIHDEIEALDIDRADTFWTDALREKIATDSPWHQHEFEPVPGTVDPRELVTYLNDALPAERRIVVDGSYCTKWPVGGVETEPGDMIWTKDFQSIGLGIYMGIGAALHPDGKTAVAFCGDASFMMSIHDLDTAVRHDVPVIYVVLNDDALGAEYHKLEGAGGYAETSLMKTPDLAEIAKKFGADGYTVGSIEELERIEDTFTEKPDGPLVLNCKINRNVTKN